VNDGRRSGAARGRQTRDYPVPWLTNQSSRPHRPSRLRR
jgi:hypothetical protein